MPERVRNQIEQLVHENPLLSGVEVDDVLRLLRDEGIETLEHLVERTLAAQRAPTADRTWGQPVAGPEWTNPAQFRTEDPATIRHRPPECALVIDGINYDPADIARFDGQPLHMVLSSASHGSPVLYAFSEDLPGQALKASMASRILTTASWPGVGSPWPYTPDPLIPGGACGYLGTQPCTPPGTAHPPPPPYYAGTVQMFDDATWRGNWFWLPVGHWWPDLTQVSRGSFLGFRGDWNDVMSSVAATNSTVVLYEHTYKGGSSFVIAPGRGVDNLETYGWNDRTSSVENLP